ncbi:MAG: hypothetical protein ACLGHN_14110 [Bacteriovoracia bacterium]
MKSFVLFLVLFSTIVMAQDMRFIQVSQGRGWGIAAAGLQAKENAQQYASTECAPLEAILVTEFEMTGYKCIQGDCVVWVKAEFDCSASEQF